MSPVEQKSIPGLKPPPKKRKFTKARNPQPDHAATLRAFAAIRELDRRAFALHSKGMDLDLAYRRAVREIPQNNSCNR